MEFVPATDGYVCKRCCGRKGGMEIAEGKVTGESGLNMPGRREPTA